MLGEVYECWCCECAGGSEDVECECGCGEDSGGIEHVCGVEAGEWVCDCVEYGC